MIQAVFFDVDGTLIDSVEAHARAWVEAFDEEGVAVSLEAVRRQIGKGADQLLPLFLPKDAVQARGAALAERQGRLYAERHQSSVRPFASARALFLRLRSEGARIFLASSGKSDDVERAAHLAGVEDLVDGAATSEDAARSKPAADIFKAALERAAPAPASSTAAVGDTPFDAKAALGAGVAPIGVVGGVYGEAELRAAGCRAVYRDLEDLLRRMDQSPLAGAR